MRIILRAASSLLLLLAFAMRCLRRTRTWQFASTPAPAPASYCVKGSLTNLLPTTIAVSYIELWIYDAKTCKRICVTRKVINQKIKPCDSLNFDLCCKNPSPSFVSAIYYVRVHHSAGINEAWVVNA
jgi:hypothetical protein